MSNGTAHSVPLPDELLEYIFDLATYGPSRDVEALTGLRTFEGDYSTDIDSACDATLKTKYALSLTCSLFRNLCSRFLFEDVRVGHGSEGLADALERNPQLGLLVKRISISSFGFKAAGHWCASYPPGTRRILQRCPNVVILTRPFDFPVESMDLQDDYPLSLPLSTEVELDDLEFPHLRRVDWFNSPFDSLPTTLPTPKFIWKTESLEVLTVGPDHSPVQNNEALIVDLPNLHTVRVRSIHTPGVIGEEGVEPAQIRLPALRRIVFSLPDGIYPLFFQQFLRACGPQIEELELAPNPRFLKHDFISVLMINCSNATTLNFPVFTTKPTRKNLNRQVVQIIYMVTHIGLSAAGFRKEDSEESGYFGGAASSDEEDDQWGRLAAHFLALFGERTRFSKVEKLTLYGREWEAIIPDPKFRGMLNLVKSKNVEIVCEDASVAATLNAVSESLRFWLTGSR